MILRVLTARVPSQNIGQFNELLRAQLVELRDQPGLVYVKLARRLEDDQTEEVVLIEEWSTTTDLFEWTRGRLTAPRLLPGTEALVENLVITHYEALDLSAADLQRRVLGTAGLPGIDEVGPRDGADDETSEEPLSTKDVDAEPPGTREPAREASPT
jgi:Antibiotic biosynthesis monooxygenase